MVHRSLIIFFIVFISISCSNANQDGIFREISIWPNGEITIGEEFQQRDEVAVQIAPYMFELTENSFGGASSIIVFTDSLYLVENIRFQYSVDFDFDKEADDYKTTLGQPSKVISSDTLDLVIWKDEKTTFELSREKNGSQIINYSYLKDNL